MADIELEHLTKRYGAETAVDDVDLDVEDGEFVTLVGPAGCGKSTILEMIAGLTEPTEGQVYVAGDDVTDLPPKDRPVAMVFGNAALLSHVDVYDNVSFPLRLRGFGVDEIDRRVERAVDLLRLEGLLDRLPDELSSEQRQRVAIARAVVREPAVLLMDDPLADLDPALRAQLRTDLQRLHRELGATIVYATRDQAEAMAVSTRIAVMAAGELQQVADPRTCYDRPANRFVAGFIGSPGTNFFDGEVTGDGVRTPYFEIAFDPGPFGLAPGRAVILGVRPEAVALSDSAAGIEEASEPIPATVDVVEPVGDEVAVSLLLGGTADPRRDVTGGDGLLASVPPDPSLTDEAEGRRVRVRIDRTRIHLFDAESGEALAHGITEPVPREPEAASGSAARGSDTG